MEKAKGGQINLATTNFDSVKDLIRDDPRYEIVSRDDRKSIFDNFMKDLKKVAIQSFRDLLTESFKSGLITWKTKTSGADFEKIKGLLKVS